MFQVPLLLNVALDGDGGATLGFGEARFCTFAIYVCFPEHRILPGILGHL
jgi:hypothetical protein